MLQASQILCQLTYCSRHAPSKFCTDVMTHQFWGKASNKYSPTKSHRGWEFVCFTLGLVIVGFWFWFFFSNGNRWIFLLIEKTLGHIYSHLGRSESGFVLYTHNHIFSSLYDFVKDMFQWRLICHVNGSERLGIQLSSWDSS